MKSPARIRGLFCVRTMNLFDILNAPWAIEPTKLKEICAVYDAHARGESVDIAAIEARLGRPLENREQGFDVVDGVAIVPLFGVMAKRANLFSRVSGGASAELVMRDLRDAVDDPEVAAILLHIDSPGGSVDGTQQLRAAIKEAAESKPLAALADGVMASAAYWSGSAAPRVYIADGTTSVGSIGVVMEHTDTSGSDALRGVKRTAIVAGRYKRVDGPNGGLSETGQQSLQEKVDYIYSLFVQDVAANRGVSVDDVLENMADGRVFIGEQAVEAGLVDGVTTIDDLIAELSQQAASLKARGVNPPSTSRVHLMDINQLKAEHPDLCASIRDEGFNAGLEQGRAQGATAERDRILGIEAQAMPGHEDLIATLKADGKTSAGDAAVQILAAEKKKLGDTSRALHDDAPEAVKPPKDGGDVKASGDAALVANAQALAAEKGISLVAALKQLGVK